MDESLIKDAMYQTKDIDNAIRDFYDRFKADIPLNFKFFLYGGTMSSLLEIIVPDTVGLYGTEYHHLEGMFKPINSECGGNDSE